MTGSIDNVSRFPHTGVLSAQFTLTVTVTDVNDNSPYCSTSLYSASIAEQSPTNTVVAQLVCQDADSGAPNNNIASYTIQSGQTGITYFEGSGPVFIKKLK